MFELIAPINLTRANKSLMVPKLTASKSNSKQQDLKIAGDRSSNILLKTPHSKTEQSMNSSISQVS